MKCEKCGTENDKNEKYCNSCGAELQNNNSIDHKVDASNEITIISDEMVSKGLILNNRFKIKKKLGKGGMGEIFLAEDIRLKRSVAIKTISDKSLEDKTSKARFLREAQTASQLDHSNICTIYEIFEDDKNEYIVMQYIDGVTLEQILKLKKLSMDKILDIYIQICKGMMEAHSKGVIHRDIKVSNIMIDKNGVVKILDFGLAKFKDKSFVEKEGMVDSDLTERGIVIGTVSFMSPEQARGRELDQRTDIFSFGIVMYELIEGKNPFIDKGQIETLYNVLNKEVEFSIDIPEELKEILLKCLEKDKKNRYSNFSEIKKDIEEFESEYKKRKELTGEFKATQIMDSSEQEKIMKEIQKSTDKDDLGEMVYRIKKMKASTEPVFSTKIKRFKFLTIFIFLLIAIFATVLVLKKNYEKTHIEKNEKNFFIYLNHFQDKTNEKYLSKKLDYLLTNSLNQFKGFKTIDEDTGFSILGNKDKNLDINALKKKFNIKYELKGKITRFNDTYDISAVLIPLIKGGKSNSITITGKNRDSFLILQVDYLTKRIFKFIYDKKEDEFEFFKVSKIYGKDWKKFSDFFMGYEYYKKFELSKAKRYFLKSDDLLISKYLLADLFYFIEDNVRSLKKIDEIMPHIDDLTEYLRLKVLALKARLNLNFKEEIGNLEKLKNNYGFLKEVFYELGEAYFHHGNAEKAMLYYEKAIKIHKNYSKAINHLGYCYSYMGDHNRAIGLFEDYRNIDRSANSFDSLGDGLFYSGDLVASESLKEAAVSRDASGVPWAYITLIDISILKAEYEKAEIRLQEYGKVVSSKKDRANILAKKAFIFYVNKDYKEAFKTINQSIETFDSSNIIDNTAEIHWVKGLILLRLDKLNESKKELSLLKQFVEKYKLSKDNYYIPFKYYLHLNALVLEKEGKIVEAEEIFKSLISMKTQLSYWITYYNYQFFHTEYADFLFRKKRYKTALMEIDRCLEFNSNYIPALWLKALVLEKLNNKERFSIYNKISELYVKSKESNYLRNLLNKKIKNNTEAQK